MRPSTGHGDNLHPPLPNTVPPTAQRLRERNAENPIFSVKQCPHCETVWNRDINACRYVKILLIIGILVLFMRVLETTILDQRYLDLQRKGKVGITMNNKTWAVEPRPNLCKFF